MELGITTSPTPERYTVHVAGEVDISNADALRTAIDLALEQPPAEVEARFFAGVLYRLHGHRRTCGRRTSCA